jgi:hypothetical protein
VFVSCWSVKGGSGTTVVAAALALGLAATGPAGSVLVDLGGDAAAVLGLAEPGGPGVSDWLAAGPSVPTDGWSRLEVPAGAGVALVPRGRGPLDRPDRAEVLAGLLGADHRPVVVDCGVVPSGPGSPADSCATVLASHATRSLLITRACSLALRRAAACPFRPSGVVLVREPGRLLRADDVAAAVGADVWAEVHVDPAVARAVDTGLLATRLPRRFARALRDAA